MNTVKCICCDSTVELHKSVNCCVCKRIDKIDCAGVSTAEARKIHQKSGLSWSCKYCIELGSDLNALKSAIVLLQDEIKVLKTTISTTQNKASRDDNSLLETEKVIQEISEREKRKSNIMIYGCKEDTVNSNKDQHILDADKVSQILSTLDIAETEYSLFRLGKFDSTNVNRCRPLKICFSSPTPVNKALRNASKLKSTPNLNGIFISSDKTPMQIALYRNTKAELNTRLANGEQNLSLKYRNGIPTIISARSLN